MSNIRIGRNAADSIQQTEELHQCIKLVRTNHGIPRFYPSRGTCEGTGLISLISNLEQRMDRIRFFGKEGWWGKNAFGVGVKPDTFCRESIACLRGTHPEAGWFTKNVLNRTPTFMRKALGGSLEAFTKIPGMNRVANWFQYGLLFDGVTTVTSDIYKGTRDNGVLGGLKAGIASAGKTAAFGALTIAGALALPALLGVSATSLLGITLGIGTTMVAARLAKPVLDRLMPTPTSRQEAREKLEGDLQAQQETVQSTAPEEAPQSIEPNPFAMGPLPMAMAPTDRRYLM